MFHIKSFGCGHYGGHAPHERRGLDDDLVKFLAYLFFKFVDLHFHEDACVRGLAPASGSQRCVRVALVLVFEFFRLVATLPMANEKAVSVFDLWLGLGPVLEDKLVRVSVHEFNLDFARSDHLFVLEVSQLELFLFAIVINTNIKFGGGSVLTVNTE